MNDEVIMIPIAEIHVLNPRHRDQKKFEVIVNSIKTSGLEDADYRQPAGGERTGGAEI
jgi:hypothetical protein